MFDVLALPPHPDLEQYKNVAEDLHDTCKPDGSGAVGEWAKRSADKITRMSGVAVTAEAIEKRWSRFRKGEPGTAQCALADAQLFTAREHGFASWPKFTSHLQAAADPDSTVSKFEAAADAIAGGDAAKLDKLLRENPDLVRARSTREHHSALLHYVSANGVEHFRQKTPSNIVAIAKLLLEAGADVNAESGAYGGRSTPLGLTATSVHPEKAGIQLPLMELLIAHGAVIDGPDGTSAVNSCLSNGRGKAAEFLATRGARLDLEGAAGIGRLDLVQNFFNHDGSLKPPATAQQLKDGFSWACEFGRTSVVEFLLQRGAAVDAKLRPHGQTGLDWAAYGGHVDIVRLLLQSGASIGDRDDSYGGTPIEWALYAWVNVSPKPEREAYYEVVAILVQSGAALDWQWFETNRGNAEKIRSDPDMLAALRGHRPV